MNNKKKILKFINKYEKEYPKSTFNYIQKILDSEIKNKARYDFMNQIYSALNMLPKKYNLYIDFIKIIKKRHSLNQNILEIGCGRYPALSCEIAKIQRKKKAGTITACDPLLMIDNIQNIKLIKDEFKDDTEIQNYDLIIASYPCESTELIVKKACKAEKAFSILLCDCEHDIAGEKVKPDDWKIYLHNIAVTHSNNKFKVYVDFIDLNIDLNNMVLSYVKI